INLSRLDEKTAPETKEGIFATKKGGGPKGEDDGKTAPAEAKFRQVVGDANEGTLARFLQDQLKLLFWYRSQRDSNLVFGAQVRLDRLIDDLRSTVQIEPA